MQISCPSCKTRISVPDDKIKPEGTKVKCGKCTKIFTVKKKAADTDTQRDIAAPAAKPPAPKPAAKVTSAFGGESSSELDDLFGDDLKSTPAASAPPPPPPPVRKAAPDPLPEPHEDAGSMLNDPFGNANDAADKDFETNLGGDNFGADMANFQTQMRPMGGGKNSDLFGGAEDLDDVGIKSPTRDHSAASMFGGGGDLSDDDPMESLKPEKTPAKAAAGDDLDDLFGARDEEPAPRAAAKVEAPVRSKPKPVMPPKESLDDLFGKGLDDEQSDDFVNQLRESKPKPAAPKSSTVDDLFANDESPFGKPEPKSPARAPANKLDSLFDADDALARPAPKAKESPRPAMAESKGPTAEDLAATMKLEPALKEEDAPKAPPPKSIETKQADAKKKFVFPVKAAAYLVVALVLAGGVGAVVMVPELNKQAADLVKLLPLDQIKEILNPAPKAAPVEVVRVSTSVSGGRMLQGGRGDSMYVMNGNVRNDYPASRSFIKIRGILLDAEGNTISTREVFAGNTLNDEEIRGLDRVKIDGILNRSVGDGLSNFNVPAGNSIPFQIVFYDVETPVTTTRIEPVSSEPGN